MIDLELTTFHKEVLKVIQSGTKPVYAKWELEFIIKGKRIAVIAVDSINFFRDYLNDYTDTLTTTVIMPEGTFQTEILPFKDNLQVRLTRVPMTVAQSASESTTEDILTSVYNAYLYDNGSSRIEANSQYANSKTILNRVSMIDVKLMLVNKVIENLRLRTIGAVYRNVIGVELLRSILTEQTRLAASNTTIQVKGVDVVPEYNPLVKKQIVIPHGTPILGPDNSLPRCIETELGGIYNTGFNYYYQKGTWFLYPLYNTDRFSKTSKTLTIINVPKSKYPSIERTYRLTATQLIVLSTGDTKHLDTSLSTQANEGNGVMFIDSTNMVKGFTDVDLETGKVLGNGKTNINTFMGVERGNKQNAVRRSSDNVSNNYFLEYSKIAARKGSIITTIWENSKPELIYPGMPVKFMYLSEDIPKELFGTVIGTDTFHLGQGTNITDRAFNSTTAISVFVQNAVKV